MAGMADFIAPLYKGLDTFNREMIGFIPSVKLDADVARAALNEKVLSPVSTVGSIVDLSEASWADYKPVDDGSVDTVEVTMENQQVVRINLGGEDTRGTSNSGTYDMIIEGKMQDAFRKLANNLEQYVANKAIVGASRAIGTAGTTPFGTAGDMMDFANLAKVLDVNGCPIEDRNLVLSPAAMANMRGKQTILLKTNEAGTDEFLRSGFTSPVLGFKLWNSSGLSAHTNGFAANNTAGAAYDKGDTVIDLGTADTAATAGDYVTIGGENYVINDVEATGASITIGKPGLLASLASGGTITKGASYTPSVAFQKNAIVLATRQLSDPKGGDGADEQFTLVDPYSGIAFDVRLYRMYHKAWLEIGLAYGSKVVKSDNVAILLG